jgi:hypothetical protein
MILYFSPCPGITGSGLSVIELRTRSNAEPPVDDFAVALLSP